MNLKKVFIPLLVVLFVACLGVTVQAATNNTNDNALTLVADDNSPPSMLTAFNDSPVQNNMLNNNVNNEAAVVQNSNNSAVSVSYNLNPAQATNNMLTENNNVALVANNNFENSFIGINSDARNLNNAVNNSNRLVSQEVALSDDNNSLLMTNNNAAGNVNSKVDMMKNMK